MSKDIQQTKMKTLIPPRFTRDNDWAFRKELTLDETTRALRINDLIEDTIVGGPDLESN